MTNISAVFNLVFKDPFGQNIFHACAFIIHIEAIKHKCHGNLICKIRSYREWVVILLNIIKKNNI